jgi:hypothetical protein
VRLGPYVCPERRVSPNDVASHPRRPESSATSLRGPQISHTGLYSVQLLRAGRWVGYTFVLRDVYGVNVDTWLADRGERLACLPAITSESRWSLFMYCVHFVFRAAVIHESLQTVGKWVMVLFNTLFQWFIVSYRNQNHTREPMYV